MNPFLVVPTLGNRESLWDLVRDAQMPAFVIWTHPTEDPPPSLRWLGADVTVKVDRGPIDIHRWWNAGCDLAASANLGPAVIVNDDVRAAPGALRELAGHIDAECVLAYPHAPDHANIRCTPITGYCFAIDADRIRPPQAGFGQQLRWWWGDHDTELRARRYGLGAVKAIEGLDIEHLRTDWHYDRPREIAPLIVEDRKLFNARWAHEVGEQ